MRMATLCAVLCGVMVCVARSPLEAQTIRRTPVVDIGLGGGRGFGGEVSVRTSLVAANATLSSSVRTMHRGALLVAVSSGFSVSGSDDCVGLGPCPRYPSYAFVGPRVGWAMRHDQASGVRVLLGPSYFKADIPAQYAKSGIGYGARLDGAERLTSRLSIALWVEQLWPLEANSIRLAIVTGGIGFRIHQREK